MVDQAGEDIDERWILRAFDRLLLGNKTGTTRLGFTVLLKMFQAEGRFPADRRKSLSQRSRSSLVRSAYPPPLGAATIGTAEPSRITGSRSAMPSAFARPRWTMSRPSRTGSTAR